MTLDLFRLAACCLVVFLHMTTPVSWRQELAVGLTRFAVPFFFAVSGMFATCVSGEGFVRRGRSAMRFACGAVAFYILMGAAGLWNWSGAGLPVTDLFTMERLVRFLFWNDFPYAYPLWYLFALVYVYAFYGILWKGLGQQRATRALLIIGTFVLVMRFVLLELPAAIGEPLVGDRPVWDRSWLGIGVPAFALGLAFGSKRLQRWVQRVPWVIWAAVMVLGALLMRRELISFGSQELFFGSLVMVVAALGLSVAAPHPFEGGSFAPFRVRWGAVSSLGAKPAAIAYVVHLWVARLLWGPVQGLGVPEARMGIVMFFVAFAVSLALGEAYTVLKTAVREVLARHALVQGDR